jgi:phage terminase small subunit
MSEAYNTALIDRDEWAKEAVLSELRAIALADIRSILDESGGVKPASEWPEEIARVIAGIDQFEEFEGRGSARVQVGWTKKIKFWDKLKALELIGKELKMFVDKTDNSHSVKLEDLILKSHSPPQKEENAK